MGTAGCHRATAWSTPPGAWQLTGPECLLAVIGAGMAAMASACWRGSWAHPGLESSLAGAGRAAGLTAACGAVVMVVMVARLPPVERLAGTGRLARWHLLGGRCVTGAILSYALLAASAHAVAAGTATAPLTGLPGYPQTVMAAAAGLALLGTDAALAGGRIAYPASRALHVCGYVAVVVIFGGQFTRCGPDGVAWSVPLAAAIAVTWYRVVTPAVCLSRHQLRVVRVRSAGPDAVAVDIGGVALAALYPAPGQFLRWRFLARGLWWRSSPYPVSAAPGGDRRQITVLVRCRDGDVAARLRPGTRVTAEGPSAALAARSRRMLMLARGTGVGPVRAVLSAPPPGTVTLIYHAGHRTGVCSRELHAIAAAHGARVYHVTGTSGPPQPDPLSRGRCQPRNCEAFSPLRLTATFTSAALPR